MCFTTYTLPSAKVECMYKPYMYKKTKEKKIIFDGWLHEKIDGMIFFFKSEYYSTTIYSQILIKMD